VQDRDHAKLGLVAFMVSMLVVADIVAAGRVPAAIVRILQRFARDRGQRRDQVSADRRVPR